MIDKENTKTGGLIMKEPSHISQGCIFTKVGSSTLDILHIYILWLCVVLVVISNMVLPTLVKWVTPTPYSNGAFQFTDCNLH